MKGKVLQQYYLLLVENRLEQFEQKLSSHFLISFGKLVTSRLEIVSLWIIKV